MVRTLMWLTFLATGQDSRPIAGELDAALPRHEMLARVREQLGSSGVRAVAWGAYNAGEHGLRAALPELRRVLGLLRNHELTEQKKVVVLAVLDAVVRLEAELPLEEIAPWFHDQDLQAPALVLLGRRPAECAGFLLANFSENLSDLAWLTVCNLLLEADPEGLARSLMQKAGVRIDVRVTDDQLFFGALRCCCRLGRDSRSPPAPAMFPPVPSYELMAPEDAPRDVLRAVCLASGPRPVWFKRRESARHWVRFSGADRDLDRSAYRVLCLQGLAGLGDLPLIAAPVALEHKWTDAVMYLREMTDAMSEVRGNWQVILLGLMKKGLLTPPAACSPLRFDVRVQDDRGYQGEDIPELTGQARPASPPLDEPLQLRWLRHLSSTVAALASLTPLPGPGLAAGPLDPRLAHATLATCVRKQLRAAGVKAVAWGACNAGEHGLREVVPELRGVLAILKAQRLTEQKRLVARAVFDALVRLEAELPPEELAPWFHETDLQVPALILAARRPKESAGFLLATLAKANTDLVSQAICNLLLDADPSGFVRQSLPEIRFQIEVLVHDPVPECEEPVPGGRMPSVANPAIRTWPGPAGFPPTPHYQLVQDGEVEEPALRSKAPCVPALRSKAPCVPALRSKAPCVAVCFAPGPEPVSFVRGDNEQGILEIGGSAVRRSDESSKVGYRLRCMLELAGLDDAAALAPEIRVQHEWRDAQRYVASVENELARIGEHWRNLLAQLARAGLIGSDAVQRPLPAEIFVRDWRCKEATALPALRRASPFAK